MGADLSIWLAIAGGVLTVLSPYVLPILPILVGRSLQSSAWGSVVLVTGLVAGFAVAGSLLGLSVSWLGGLATGLRTGAIAILLVLGLLAIFPTWSYRLFQYLPLHRWIKETPRIGLAGDFGWGRSWVCCGRPVLGLFWAGFWCWLRFTIKLSAPLVY